MTYDLPLSLPHFSTDDRNEVCRLLDVIFKKDADAANRWLNERSGFFNSKPGELLRRDELGVMRVLSYLKDAAA